MHPDLDHIHIFDLFSQPCESAPATALTHYADTVLICMPECRAVPATAARSRDTRSLSSSEELPLTW